jgi:Ni,Fe-hydrogenase I cytochrome b subunit
MRATNSWHSIEKQLNAGKNPKRVLNINLQLRMFVCSLTSSTCGGREQLFLWNSMARPWLLSIFVAVVVVVAIAKVIKRAQGRISLNAAVA